jgi:hypothetical protein
MKNIDDKMIEKALRNLKLNHKFKPIAIAFGLFFLLMVGFLAYILYLYIQKPFPEQFSAQEAFIIAFLVYFIGFNLFMSVFWLCTGMGRNYNYKDIILEHLAEQYLEQKKETDGS